MSEKMREAIVAYMSAGVGMSTDYEKQADARRLATEALAEQFASTVKPALVVYGDGEHDDTDALQAYFDGSRNVVNPDGTPFRGIDANGARYRTSRPLSIPTVINALRIALNALLDHGDERHIAGAVGALEFALAEQPAPALPDGWLRAIDEAMVVHHAGVAKATDTYEEARFKINLLLCIAQDIGALHAVPDGWKLVPVEPTDEMIDAGCDASSAFRVDIDRSYRAMLAAAPEVKRG